MDAISSQFAWLLPLLLIQLVAIMPVMAAPVGGRRHLVDLPLSLPPTATLATQRQDSGGVSSSGDSTAKTGAFLVLFMVVVLALACYIRHTSCRDEEQETSRDNGRGRQNNNRGEALPPPRRQHQQQTRPAVAAAPSARGRQQRRPGVAAAAAAPPAVDVELAQAPVLECTFRAADGWTETTCSVCLSEMADGEKVRVLTACVHCFHTACVEQWLREHTTCPLCRAPTAATAAKGRSHQPRT